MNLSKKASGAVQYKSRLPHIMVLGLRGFPDVQGGVETHCQHLFPKIAALDFNVTVITRSPYQPKQLDRWQGVRFVNLWAPKTKSLEALVHSVLGVLYAAIRRPDILHIQAIGPALVTPLARLFGLKVVVTHHGPDYDRQKWGKLARWSLRSGEWLGMRLAQARIVISKTIQTLVKEKHNVSAVLIPNGVILPNLSAEHAVLNELSLTPQRYVLLVSRLVPEKRHLDLLEAFQAVSLPGWKLVFVGASDHPDAYVQGLLERAAGFPNVVIAGFRRGAELAALYSHAGLFVLPSSHEGLPIALLEALSYGLPAIASDIPANLEVNLPANHYFSLGDKGAIAQKLIEFSKKELTIDEREQIRSTVIARFNWDAIAHQTAAVYQTCLGATYSVTE
jgi:glycosyltransferase involved in cell wall biosynthesis